MGESIEGGIMEHNETLEKALLMLRDKMRNLDEEWQSRASPGYQHHDIATNMVMLWFHQAEDMLRMLYGTDEKTEEHK